MKPMKKCVALLLAVLMALSVAGCAESLKQIEIPPFPVVTPTPAPASSSPEPTPEQAEETAAPQPEEGEQPTEPPAAAAEERSPRILVSFANTSLQEFDPKEEQELILTFAYDMLRIHSEDYP